MAVDYFSKWAKAEALANIWDVDVKKFVWRNIVIRFGVLESLVLDNGLKVDSKAFHEFCGSLSITNRYSTSAYPQSSGQAEAIVNRLKRRLEGAKGGWTNELPSGLWAYQTTTRRSIGETPFSLTYGVEAVIPAEVNLCSGWVLRFSPAENSELMIK